MKYSKNQFFLLTLCYLASCSYISGPEGLFPETKNKFFEEELAPDLNLPSSDLAIQKEDHYPPISQGIPLAEIQDIPSPRQIFSSGGSNEVQLRRLGELMWVYVESLPSTSWPITKSYFESSSMPIIENDPDAGIMLIKYSDSLNFKVTIEHGIKESSTEIFLTTYLTDPNAPNASEPEFIQKELSKIVEFFASSASSFSGTSLAAQNLNDRKKARIFNLNDRTIIELLNFSDDEDDGSLLLGEAAEFKIILKPENDKTNIYVESLEGSSEDAEALISKINELLS